MAERFPYGKGWVQFLIKTREDADHALWLLGLNYKRLNGLSKTSLLEAIDLYKLNA